MNKVEELKKIQSELKLLVKKGYLKHTRKGYINSDRVTSMLKEGKTHIQISRILEKEYKKRGRCGGAL